MSIAETSDVLPELTKAIMKVADGDYDETKAVFELTRESDYPADLCGLAEAVGMLAVKVEAREFRLEQVIADLKVKQAQLDEENRTRKVFSVVLCLVTIILSLYTLAFVAMSDLMPLVRTSGSARETANYALSVVLTLVMISGIRISGLPIADFGLTLRNWQKAVRESVVYTLPVLVLCTLIKWGLVVWHPAFQGQPVLTFQEGPGIYLAYFLFVCFQEFFARGMLQGPMERCLIGTHARWLAIVMASIMFGVYHLHYSIQMASISALSGLYFGWLYSRHKTLLAACTAHYLVGVYALGPLGFMPYFLGQ